MSGSCMYHVSSFRGTLVFEEFPGSLQFFEVTSTLLEATISGSGQCHSLPLTVLKNRHILKMDLLYNSFEVSVCRESTLKHNEPVTNH